MAGGALARMGGQVSPPAAASRAAPRTSPGLGRNERRRVSRDSAETPGRVPAVECLFGRRIGAAFLSVRTQPVSCFGYGSFGPLRSRSWLLRLKGAVLIAVMLSGGGALPVLDALLYHRGAHLGRPHFETAGVPHSHGDICRLGLSAPYSPRASLLNVCRPIVAACFRADATLPATRPRSNDLPLLPQPRAP